jgi:uncharacterized protein (TIRG00374 family)
MKRRLLFVLQFAVTGLLLTLLFRHFDWARFEALLRHLPLSYYVGSLLIVLACQLLYAWRWHVLLRAGGVSVSYRCAAEQFFIGSFVNSFIPSTVGGDVARGYRLGREHGFHAVAASIVLDRVLGIGLLSALAALAMWMAPIPDAAYRTVETIMALVALGAGCGLVLMIAGTGGLSRRLLRFGPRAALVAGHVERFRHECGSARNPAVFAKAAVAVVGYFVLLTLAYEWFLDLQVGHVVAFVSVLAVVAAASALSNIPVSINGLGLREQLHVVLLHALGVPKEPAVAISLLVFMHAWMLSLAGGVFWMRTRAVAEVATDAAEAAV